MSRPARLTRPFVRAVPYVFFEIDRGTTPAVTPLTIFGASSVVVWLRSDLGITLNGSNVSAWADQSGNVNDASQSSAALQIPYVASGGAMGRPYLQSTGGGLTQLVNSTLVQATPFEFFDILDTDGSVAGYYFANDFGVGIHAIIQAPGALAWDCSPEFDVTQFPAVLANTPHMTDYLIQAGGPSCVGLLDNANTKTVASTTFGGASGYVVGGRGGGGFGWAGKIYERVVLNRAATPAEQLAMYNYKVGLYG